MAEFGHNIHRHVVFEHIENPNQRTVISAALAHDILVSTDTNARLRDLSAHDVDDHISMVLEEIATTFPYHNREHTIKVIYQAEALARSCNLNDHDVQLCRLAALYHDYDHCGFSYRQLVHDVLHPTVSNEERSARAADSGISADERLSMCLSIQDRLDIQGMILGTSFMQDAYSLRTLTKQLKLDDQIAHSLIREYSPHTLKEKILALADITLPFGVYNNETLLDSFLNRSLDVLCEDIPQRLPRDFSDHIEKSFHFLALLTKRIRSVQELMNPLAQRTYQDGMEKLWKDLEHLHSNKELHQSMKDRFHRVAGFVREHRRNIINPLVYQN